MTNSKASKAAVRYVEVDELGDGQRIDNFLLRELKGVPRTLIYRLLRKGQIRVNKGRAKPGHRLQQGDTVRIPPIRVADRDEAGKPGGRLLNLVSESIVYEDDILLVLNKASGLAVHGGSGISFGVIEILRHLRPQEKGLELAHRLDRDTSGCLIVAKRRSALRTLQELQRQGKMDKRYLALLKGHWRRGREQVRVPLKKNTLKSGERVVRVDPQGKPAHTEFLVMSRFRDSTLVEVKLHTGRTHQIRVHSAHLGSPILGDTKYGDDDANRLYRGRGLKRLFLHAAKLRFPWPGSSKVYELEAPLPQELELVLDKIA